jgi:hypothetical protein
MLIRGIPSILNLMEEYKQVFSFFLIIGKLFLFGPDNGFNFGQFGTSYDFLF